MHRRAFAYIVFAAVICLSADELSAQSADTVITQVQEVARFQEARAVAVDPSGRFYVIDAARSSIYRLTPEGVELDRLGGPGSGDYEFDDPRDVDPTNGLVIHVADAGNQRIQRFSSELRFLESIPVHISSGTAARASGRTGFRMRNADPLDAGDGRPIAVTSENTGEIYALDEIQNAVIKWNNTRRVERTFGGYDSGEGALVEPKSIAVDRNGTVYVADRGLAGVAVFDSFGSYIRTLAAGHARDVRRVRVYRNRVFVIMPARLMVYDFGGVIVRTYDVELDEPLLDLAVWDDQLYLLTATRLVRANP